MADRSEVVAWLEANGWRYTAAAKLFGLDKDVARAWGREARGLARARAGATAPEPEATTPSPTSATADQAEPDPGPRLLPPVPVPPTSDPREVAVWRARLGPVDYALAMQALLEEMIDETVAQEKFNAAGLAALVKRAEDNKARLFHLLEQQPDQLATMAPSELVAHVELNMKEWPDIVLETAFTVYGNRHRGRILFVSDAGHRAEWDGEERQWLTNQKEAS